MNRRLRTLATVAVLAATGTLSGCYAGYGGSAGYGGYTRAGGGSSGSFCYRSGRISGGTEDLLLYAGFYAGAALIAGTFELIDRCWTYCR